MKGCFRSDRWWLLENVRAPGGVIEDCGSGGLMHFEPWQWILAVAAALLVGVSKTGIGGLGMLSVVIFAQIMPAKQATGSCFRC